MNELQTLRADEVRARIVLGSLEDLPFRLGRYQLVERIGLGATSEVFRALDTKLSDGSCKAYVTIKLSLEVLAPPGRKYMTNEARRARCVVHPNVVRALDFGSFEGRPYIVFEYVDGVDLWSHVSLGHGLSVREAVRVVRQVCNGIEEAHRMGLIHGDIKPDNILITGRGEVRVADFGASLLAAENDTSCIGSLAFMSPEQHRGDRVTACSDVYGLGGLLFWLLTDDAPNGSTREEMIGNLTSERTLPAPCPDRDLRMIIQRATKTQTDRRYERVSGFREDLESWLRGEAIGWTHPSDWRRLRLLLGRHRMAVAITAVVGAATVSSAAVMAYALDRRRDAEIKLQIWNENQWWIDDIKLALAEELHAELESKRHGTEAILDPQTPDMKPELVDQLAKDFTPENIVLAYYRIEANKLDDVERWLPDVLASLDSDDVWHLRVRALINCAVASRALQAMPSDAHRLQTVYDTLHVQETELDRRDRGSKVHNLVLRTLFGLCGPKGLRDYLKTGRSADDDCGHG